MMEFALEPDLPKNALILSLDDQVLKWMRLYEANCFLTISEFNYMCHSRTFDMSNQLFDRTETTIETV